jgi:hypothetical protein
MDSQRLITRIVAAGLPLLVVALVFGAIGYSTKKADQQPIPALPPAEAEIAGARGVIQSVANGQIVLTTDGGATLAYQLSPDASVELLRPIPSTAVNIGDWLNGGAIPHAQTLFALTGLVLIPDPVVTP